MARKPKSQFVIRTDKLSRPHYWAGVAKGNVGMSSAITTSIFDAWFFDDRAEAERLLKNLSLEADFTISEVSAGMSPKLTGGT